MDAVNRLIQAGIRSDCAENIVLQFEERNDFAGLERHVQAAEAKAAGRKGARTCLG